MDEQIKKYISKAALLGDTIDIVQNGGKVELKKYTTNSTKIVLPEFITDIDGLRSVFENSPNLISITMPPVMEINALYTRQIEELIVHPKTKFIGRVTGVKTLKIVLNNTIAIRNVNAIEKIPNLDIINSEYISKIGYYGINECTITSLVIRPWVLTPNSVIKCRIKELHLHHGQEEGSFKDTYVFRMYYHISKKHYIAFKEDDLAITSWIRSSLFFNSVIGTIMVIVD